uniref:peptidylprolyl isomerase n=1 Tax=Rhizophora mucronata TaxID=61149 RepID=A0A2P2J6E6_RHIMU
MARESYGEDIADTETEPSGGDDEDEYEDSFIDDGDLKVNPPSPVSSGGVTETTSNKGKPKSGKGIHRRLRKKYQVSESGDEHISEKPSISKGSTGAAVLDSQGEDKFPISSLFKSKPAAKSTKSEVEEKAEKETDEICKKQMKDDGNYISVPEQKAEAVVGNKLKMQPGQCNYILPSAEVDSKNGAKPKKKKKQKSEGKALQVGDEDDFFFGKVLRWDKGQQNEIEAYKLDQDLQVISEKDQNSENDKEDNLPHVSMPSAGVVPINAGRLKKKSKMQGKVEKDLGTGSELHHVVNREEKLQQDEVKAESIQQDMPAEKEKNQSQANEGKADLPFYCSRIGLENCTKRKRKREGQTEKETPEAGSNHHTAVKGDEAKQDELKSSSLGNDLSVCDEQKQKQDSNVDFHNDTEPYENHFEKKKKRKKKSRSWENTESSNAEIPSASSNKHIRTLTDINNADHGSSQLGLVIEELGKGKPDGKIAVPGKKISIRYTGKLKTGEVFDSNINGSPLKFCLGGKEVLESWNVGLDGLQVGGKRRLIVPPSMGYGSAGDGKKVPPNSWLVYDIELLKVR